VQQPPPAARCGDGNVDDGEQCDDGADNSDTVADACRSDCQRARCGDGAVDRGEICDDGNAVDTDACRNDCTAARCGDAVVETGVEACDDGVRNSDTLPDACRRDCTRPTCGDGVVDPDAGEACDDGNHIDTDNCRSDCTVPICGDGILWDGHEQCDDGARNSDTDPDACRSDCRRPICGDGVKDAGEACDDANEIDTDDCLIGCTLPSCGDGITWQGHEECDDGAGNDDRARNACRTACVLPRCGDGVTDAGEDCDDGNAVETDYCLSTCKAASCGDGFVKAGVEQCDLGEENRDTPGSACRTTCKTPACHDGIVDPGEACDDGNTRDNDACVLACVPATCGDGLLQRGVEACDAGDGNADAPDTCRTNCSLPTCGDGIQDAAEACDEGASNADDVPDACRRACKLPRCGDGVQDSAEECDQGKNNADHKPDACRTTCLAPRCGDGVLDSPEACDDGNVDAGDGCDASCSVEAQSLPGAGQTVTVSGSIDGTEKTFDRPDWDYAYGECQEPLGDGGYYYDAHEFVNDSGADQVILVEAHWSGSGFLVVYVDGFDPDDAFGNCQSAAGEYDWDLDGNDWDHGSRSKAVSVPAGSHLTVVATTYSSGDTTRDYDLILDNADLTVGDEEFNGDSGSATSYPSSHDTASGSVSDGDEDWYAFDAVGGQRYRLEVLSENGTCVYDYNYFGSTLEVYDADLNYLDASDRHPFYDDWNGGVGCSGLMWTPDFDGTFYFRVLATYGDTLDPYYLLVRER
jgi:cysteine-rich repeat protein